MEKWTVKYVIDDGSGMFGLEPLPEQMEEFELDTAHLERTGDDEQRILEMLRSALHQHVGGHVVLTEAHESER